MKNTARLIDGRAVAEAWREDIREQMIALGVPLGLAAVCVEGNAGLKSFVRLKEKAARDVGIQFSSYFIDPCDEAGARQTVQFLVGDESTDGIFIELPLPGDWNADGICSLIPPEKDVDALTKHPMVAAPAVLALQRALSSYEVDVRGIRAAVVGHGRLVGGPVASWLRASGADVELIDIDTPEPATIAQRADLIVTGAGKPGLVTGDWVKDGAIVIDFGYADGAGDVDVDSVKQKAGVLSPVPGGMGPLVITAVLENLLTLAMR
ncbi:MAG TPA: bifunctional 5,10-methylenetetrahydrofolate dehydrogenase/5,10-methenyltetrahydrofolate cyclohydrolase [Candidatus Paceibacterota bacterium]|nr:bifunctional 5,10-methylenetetrahydrofolate dehydrogenase/5,10-methenyltetrahydrofolate cyclohydrolase [Candidatus Paceibacterota bacterium]